MRVLLTGFEPFGNYKENSSWAVAEKVAACVLFWSVGNESGIGKNHEVMAEYFHRRMPGCFVHSEDLSRRKMDLYKKASHEDRKKMRITADYVDIDSRMYPSLWEMKHYYFENSKLEKPLFLCEIAEIVCYFAALA